MFVFCELNNLLVDRVPIIPYTFLSVSSELSEDVCFLLQKLKREEKLCGLSTGHSVCRAAPRDARALGQVETRINLEDIRQRLPLDNSNRQASGRKGQRHGRAVSQWLVFLPYFERGFRRPSPSQKSYSGSCTTTKQ